MTCSPGQVSSPGCARTRIPTAAIRFETQPLPLTHSPPEICNLVGETDLSGELALSIGSIDVMLACDYSCNILAIDVEAPLLERVRKREEATGFSERLKFRLVEPRPLPLEDPSVDVVFSKDAWIHITDKQALLAEAFRVLGLGGQLIAGDWCSGPEPYSADMGRSFELEGLTYHMATLESYDTGLRDSGFQVIELFDVSNRFQILSQGQYERMTGPIKEQMLALVGDK